MALSINENRLAGRPTQDFQPFSKGDFTVVENTLAVEDNYFRTENDERIEVERSRFIPIKFLNTQATTISRLNPKGKLLYIEGKLVDDHWTDKSGNKCMRIIVEVQSWQFAESKVTDEARRLAHDKLTQEREAAPAPQQA